MFNMFNALGLDVGNSTGGGKDTIGSLGLGTLRSCPDA